MNARLMLSCGGARLCHVRQQILQVLNPFTNPGLQRHSLSSRQDTTYVEIPTPKFARSNESIEQKKARLVYQSRKRGIKETDLILSTFSHKYLDCMTEEELYEYDRLINVPSNDWDIYYWATGVADVPSEFDGPIMRKLIEHTKNSDKESRLKQPDLPVY